MATQQFLIRLNGETTQAAPITTTTGAADAGKIIATDASGRLALALLPEDIGTNKVTAKAGVALTAGKFVTLTNVSGVLTAVLATNATAPADGFVTKAAAINETVDIFPMDRPNDALTGLTIGTRYFLGTGGDATATPLDEALPANKGKISQELGKALTTTTMYTSDYGYVRL